MTGFSLTLYAHQSAVPLSSEWAAAEASLTGKGWDQSADHSPGRTRLISLAASPSPPGSLPERTSAMGAVKAAMFG